MKNSVLITGGLPVLFPAREDGGAVQGDPHPERRPGDRRGEKQGLNLQPFSSSTLSSVRGDWIVLLNQDFFFYCPRTMPPLLLIVCRSSQADLLQLMQPFGTVSKVVMLRAKNQVGSSSSSSLLSGVCVCLYSN
jgi:hypothetical protein